MHEAQLTVTRGSVTARLCCTALPLCIQTFFPRDVLFRFTTLAPAFPFATVAVCESDPQSGLVLLSALAPLWGAAERGAVELPAKGGDGVSHAVRAELACVTGELSRAHVTARVLEKRVNISGMICVR